MKLAIAALLCTLAAPVSAQDARKSGGEPTNVAAETKDAFDMAQVMAMFDKVFPAQPEPPAARLALARFTATGLLPSGTYAAIFDDVMTGVMDRVLSLDPADFDPKGDKAKGATSLRQQIAKEDPHFDERMRITKRVIGEELVKLSAVMEPKLRDGLARAIARRFDEQQLTEINAFLATDSGKAFAGQTMRMWVDPDVMRGMVQTLPHMVTAMPGAMARLEAETAHLPKPRDKAKAKQSN